jgi:hypothetical protein
MLMAIIDGIQNKIDPLRQPGWVRGRPIAVGRPHSRLRVLDFDLSQQHAERPGFA